MPGPVIRLQRGDEAKIRLVNLLDEPTAIHWHGVRVPNPMDGAPPLTQAPVGPGESFDYRFRVPDSGTFWYRSAFRHQLGRGLFGALIVDEAAPPAADLDQVLVFAEIASGGADEPRPTLNGATPVEIAVRPNARLRLRFINACDSRVMAAHIDGHRVFVIALDGEPAEPFESRGGRVVLGPGNRADVIVDATFSAGTIAPIMFGQAAAASSAADELSLARIVYDGPEIRAAPLRDPPALAANPLPERMNFSGALRVTLPIQPGNPVASGPMVPRQTPLFTVERGRTVNLALDNREAAEHVVHVHGHHFRLLDRLDDGWKPYWLDTIVVPGRQIARIAFVADNPGRWLIARHGLRSAAGGVDWFQVK